MTSHPYFGFRLPPELVKELEETAKQLKITRQQAMIEAMNLWLSKT